jgi:hypothetical protein
MIPYFGLLAAHYLSVGKSAGFGQNNERMEAMMRERFSYIAKVCDVLFGNFEIGFALADCNLDVRLPPSTYSKTRKSASHS